MAKLKIDLGEAFGLGKELVELIVLIVRATRASSDGGKKITAEERDDILERVQRILKDAVEAQDE